MSPPPSLTVAAPAYNERENVPRFVEAFAEVLAGMVKNGEVSEWRVLLVNDGSGDGTGALLENLAAERPWLQVTHHVENRGYAAAFQTALMSVRTDWVLITDADLPVEPGVLPGLLEKALKDGADVVSAVRQGRWETGKKRAVMSWVYGALVKLKFSLPYRDVNFACKLIRREVLEKVLPLKSNSLFIDPELLIKARAAGFEIRQTPVRYVERVAGESTLGSWKNVWATLADWWRIPRSG